MLNRININANNEANFVYLTINNTINVDLNRDSIILHRDSILFPQIYTTLQGAVNNMQSQVHAITADINTNKLIVKDFLTLKYLSPAQEYQGAVSNLVYDERQIIAVPKSLINELEQHNIGLNDLTLGILSKHLDELFVPNNAQTNYDLNLDDWDTASYDYDNGNPYFDLNFLNS